MLLIVFLLVIKDVDLTIIAIVAFLGLTCFWWFSTWHGKKLGKQFYEQERDYYEALFPSEKSKNFDLILPHTQDSPLTKRELEVLLYIIKGNINKEIAVAMNITDQTVKNHITHILKKMDVPDRTSAAVTALRQGWIKTNIQGQMEITSFTEEVEESRNRNN